MSVLSGQVLPSSKPHAHYGNSHAHYGNPHAPYHNSPGIAIK